MITSIKAFAQLSYKPFATKIVGLANAHKGVYFFAGNSLLILAKTVNLPFLADSINEGTVAKFLKSFISFI